MDFIIEARAPSRLASWHTEGKNLGRISVCQLGSSKSHHLELHPCLVPYDIIILRLCGEQTGMFIHILLLSFLLHFFSSCVLVPNAFHHQWRRKLGDLISPFGPIVSNRDIFPHP